MDREPAVLPTAWRRAGSGPGQLLPVTLQLSEASKVQPHLQLPAHCLGFCMAPHGAEGRAGQAVAALAWLSPLMPLVLFSSAAAGTGSSGSSSSSGRTRRRWLPWPFALRRGPARAARAPGQEGSGCSRALFGQPLAAVCAEDGTLPRPIQVRRPHRAARPSLWMLHSQCPHACPPAMGHWALQPCLRLLLPAPLQQEAASPGWGRALRTGQLLTQAPALPPLLQELLAVLHQEGPTTEGIFQKAESAKA